MQQNKSKEVFNTTKTITKGIDRSSTSSSIRSSSGELLSNPDEVKQRVILINHSSKILVLLEIIRSRMKPYVEAILAEEQAGFTPGRSPVEQVFALKMLIQHRIEKKDGKVFAVFIDYKKILTEFGMMACFLCYSSMVSLENSSTSSGISTARPKAALE